MTSCSKRNELTVAASQALERMKAVIQQQITVLHEGEGQSKLMSLDKDLEKAFGEKERAFGALTTQVRSHAPSSSGFVSVLR